MNNILLSALYQAAAVGVLACLISESAIMHRVRELIKWDLLYCPICLSFWLSAPALFEGVQFYFAVVAFSNLWVLTILKTYEALEAE